MLWILWKVWITRDGREKRPKMTPVQFWNILCGDVDENKKYPHPFDPLVVIKNVDSVDN